MRRALYAVLFAMILLAAYSASVWAETEQAQVTADDVWYDYESKQVEATGNVKINYKNIKVESDHAILDQEENILLATGHVVVNDKNDIYQGDKFVYYLKSELGWIEPAKAIVHDPDLQGPAYLSSSETFIKGEEIISKHSSFTSCDLAHPHYHFTAKSLDYYPDERIVLHHVWYWEHRIPLFYFPIFYISLKKDNFEVNFGSTAAEGWFLDTKYWFYPWDYQWGYIDSRLTEYGGDYFEVGNYNYTSPTGTLSEKFGYLDKRNMTNPKAASYTNLYNAAYESEYDDYMFGFGYQEKINSKVSTSQSIQNWHHFLSDGNSYLDTSYNLTINGTSPYPALTLNFADKGVKIQQPNVDIQEPNYDTERTVDLLTNWNYNFDPTWVTNLNGHWYYDNYLSKDDPRITDQYLFNIKKNWGWSSLDFTIEDNQTNDVTMRPINRKPDITFIVPKWKWPLLNDVQLVTRYTHMEKYIGPTFDSEGERYAWDLQKSYSIYQQGQIAINNSNQLSYRDFLVTTNGVKNESELYAMNSKINVTDQFTKELSNTVSLGYAQTQGLKNNYFNYDGDYVDPGAFLTNILRWDNHKSYVATLSTGYNFNTRIADPVNINSDWRPDANQAIHFDTVYNWGVGLGQTDLRVNYNPKPNWNLSLMLGYNISANYWTSKSLYTSIHDRINDKLDYQIDANYDSVYDKFMTASVGLIYDWHCRKVRFLYDWIQQEYSCQIYIKAFPWAELTVTPDNTLENILNGLMSQ